MADVASLARTQVCSKNVGLLRLFPINGRLFFLSFLPAFIVPLRVRVSRGVAYRPLAWTVTRTVGRRGSRVDATREAKRVCVGGVVAGIRRRRAFGKSREREEGRSTLV